MCISQLFSLPAYDTCPHLHYTCHLHWVTLRCPCSLLLLASQSGFGGWPCERYANNYAVRSGCHPHYDGGSRARNDVWMTTDATNWTLITKAANWGARAWAAGTTWHQPGNSSRDVSRYGVVNKLAPKMWLSGGVYYGTKFRAQAEKAYSVDT